MQAICPLCYLTAGPRSPVGERLSQPHSESTFAQQAFLHPLITLSLMLHRVLLMSLNVSLTSLRLAVMLLQLLGK